MLALRLTGACAFVALASTTHAQVSYLVTEGTTLYRTNGVGAVQSFSLSDEIVGLTRTPDGQILATSSTLSPTTNMYEIYRLDGAFSATPSLTLLSDQLPFTYTTMSFIGDTLYADRGGTRFLVTLDPDAGYAETPVGINGDMGINPVGGSGYDAATDTLYVVSGGDNNAIYTVDYALQNGTNPTATLVGGVGFDLFHSGMEFYDGTLYAALNNVDAGDLSVGTINTATGAFSPQQVILQGNISGPVSMLVVPAPSAAAILGVGALAAARRRRVL